MASQRSAVEVREHFLKVFPGDCGVLYHSLWNRLITAYLTWDMYKSLYRDSQDRLDLLDQTAGIFFFRLRTFLQQETFLAITRITDPAQTAGSENASLRQLVTQLEPHISTEEHHQVLEAVRRAEQRAGEIKEYRHNFLAHKDLEATIGEAEVASIPAEEVDLVLDALGKALNAVRRLFEETSTHWEAPPHVGGVNSLIRALKDHAFLEETCQDWWKKKELVSLPELCRERMERWK